MKKMRRLFTGLIVAQLAAPVWAAPDFFNNWAQEGVVRGLFSPYTYHYSEDPEHKPVVVIGLDRESADGSIQGAAFFSNSFGQPSVYIYPWGQTYKPFVSMNRLSLIWTAGLLYGYLPPYENKVPLNYNGFSPAVIPAVSYDFDGGWRAQVNILGTAGLMFEISKPLR